MRLRYLTPAKLQWPSEGEMFSRSKGGSQAHSSDVSSMLPTTEWKPLGACVRSTPQVPVSVPYIVY